MRTIPYLPISVTWARPQENSLNIFSYFPLGNVPLEGFTCHLNVLPYFLHWISLTTLESLEEIKQAVLSSHATKQHDRLKAQALSCSEEELTFNMVLTGSQSFRPADGVALSRSGIANREYVGEITAIDGIILTVNIVWPTTADDSSRKDIVKGTWCLHKFPSLVGYRRISAALKAFQDMTTCGQALFEGIVGSFCISDSSSPETREKRDTAADDVQMGNYKEFSFLSNLAQYALHFR